MDFLIITFFIFILSIFSQSTLSINAPVTNQKRGILLGDLSYSYSATDIGSKSGSHVKTVTVIKNIGTAKLDKHKHEVYSSISSSEKNNNEENNNEKNPYKLFVKLTDFPHEIFSNLDFFTTKKHKTGTEAVEKVSEATNPSSETEIQTEGGDNVKAVVEVVNENGETEMNKQTEDNQETAQAARITQKLRDDVEFIKSDPIAPFQAKLSAKAQSDRIVEYAKSRFAADEEYKNKEKTEEKSQKLLSALNEEFSDYSMHNVKHFNNQEFVKKSAEIKKISYKSTHPVTEIHQKPYIAPKLRTYL